MNQCRPPYEPSTLSLERRAAFGEIFSGLRRVRSRTPFFRLPAHTIPTLWGLYRGLIRESPTPEIRWRMRKVFEKNRGLTGTEKTIAALKRGYKFLDVFQKARAGDTRLQGVLLRYSSMIAAKWEKEHWKQVLREEWAWQERMRNKPILTGSVLRASFDNKPMPRLYPQPDHVDHLIRHRRIAREARRQRILFLQEQRMDIAREAQFEEGLLVDTEQMAFGGPNQRTWTESIDARLHLLHQAYGRGIERLRAPISPELYKTLADARRYKLQNKTREKENERRGVYSRRTLQRMRRQPPTFVLERMSKKSREIDRALRAPGEGGYIGRIKRQQGVRMKDRDLWKREVVASDAGLQREAMVLQETLRRIKQAGDV